MTKDNFVASQVEPREEPAVTPKDKTKTEPTPPASQNVKPKLVVKRTTERFNCITKFAFATSVGH